MRIRRILVPIDFSPTSDAALAQARELAAALGATLRLVHVFEEPFVASAMGADGQMFLPADMRARMVSSAETRLQERLKASIDTSLGHEAVLLTGPVAGAIVDYAKGHAVDLIVVGTHGRSGMAHLLLGSVAEKVVRTAPCPVLTVRQSPVTEPVSDAAAAVAAPAQA